MFPQNGEFIFPIADGQIKTLGGDQNLRTSPLVRHRRIQGESDIDFLGESEGFFSTNSRLTSGCPWSNKRFLVHVGKLHMSPSRWTQSQTLLAERKIIPHSTEIQWRIQNYMYESGCQAKKTHWWLLEHWWLSWLVWSLVKFHWIYSIEKHPEGNKWSREGIDENYKESISSTRRIRNSKKPSRTRVWSWKHQWLLLFPVKSWKIVGVAHRTKLSQSFRVFWKLMNRQWKIDTASSWRRYFRKKWRFITTLQFRSFVS